MVGLIKLLRSRFNGFARANEAVAAVEFALILPVMLLVYIGSVEASSLITTDRRVQTITGTLGDLVARSNEKIPVASLINFFEAAEGIMVPFSTASLVQVVTSVRVNNDGTTTVLWSRQYQNNTMSSGGRAHSVNQPYALPSAITDISLGESVIVAETFYTFTPSFNIVYNGTIPLYRENFYLPRFETDIDLVP
ncbi:pilus assembly protein [Devosia rhodophyticola]|uniref:Pilus assembly protein n=1 Tax=Devosia rhodophyticola TaxID=3026423 RepID=A0ABY7Z020_9HYPH|nr:TadE/TadG family type IV pilus assembly protein [Devosia rhodophyticola]WDR06777.1 pilus assembly protein [Devosia rhodophyticola]